MWSMNTRGCQIGMQGPQLCAKPLHFCKLDVATSRMAVLDLNLHVLQLATSNSNNWGHSVVQNYTSDTPFFLKITLVQKFSKIVHTWHAFSLHWGNSLWPCGSQLPSSLQIIFPLPVRISYPSSHSTIACWLVRYLTLSPVSSWPWGMTG